MYDSFDASRGLLPSETWRPDLILTFGFYRDIFSTAETAQLENVFIEAVNFIDMIDVTIK